LLKVKCAKCESVKEVEKLPKKYICPDCGVLNTPQAKNARTSDQACGCLLPDNLQYLEPAGVEETPIGTLYKTADDATGITRLEWIEIYGYDPKTVLENMRNLGKEGKPGFFNTSSLGKGRAK
jgi:hypothetical protein